jgi:hypothetical protein
MVPKRRRDDLLCRQAGSMDSTFYKQPVAGQERGTSVELYEVGFG